MMQYAKKYGTIQQGIKAMAQDMRMNTLEN